MSRPPRRGLLSVLMVRPGAAKSRLERFRCSSWYFHKGVMSGAVIGRGCRGNVELVACQDAHDAFVCPDHPLLAQGAGPGDAGRRSRLTAKAAGTDFGLGVQDVLIAHFANDAAAS